MRGSTVRQLSMLSPVTPDELVPALHPIRRVRPMVDHALESLAPTFDAKYPAEGPPFDSARASAQGPPADGALFDSQ